MVRPPDWHPIMLIEEPEPGVWVIPDPLGVEHSRIRIVRVQPTREVRFRVEYEGRLLGWSSTLREAAWRAYQEWLRRPMVPPFPGYPTYARPPSTD